MCLLSSSPRQIDCVKAMVEFLSPSDAQRVKDHLDGRRIYDDSCRLRIEFAYERVYRLRVVRNDDDTWDFTADLNNNNNNSSSSSNGSSSRNNSSHDDCYYRAGMKRRFSLSSCSSSPSPSKLARFVPGFMGPSLTTPPPPPSPGVRYPCGPVCMIYDLNMREATPARLFNLLCLYGDVMRVKFLTSKDGCAMVEMGRPEAVEIAIQHLGGVQLFGNRIVVNLGCVNCIAGNNVQYE